MLNNTFVIGNIQGNVLTIIENYYIIPQKSEEKIHKIIQKKKEAFSIFKLCQVK